MAVELEDLPEIGVDLEGDSMFHYQEKICLFQISTPSSNFVIDPLSVKDLSPLAPVFADKRTRKIFHGADYDIRSLYRDFTMVVRSLFDTQIAARFLGMKETGLASLLQERFGVASDKRYQKKDWSRRPLPEPMLDYAVQDICYLLPLSHFLRDELAEKGLLFCVEEECGLLARVRPNTPKSKPFFLHFKGASRLGVRDLAVLENLLSMRDQMAKRKDCPHFKVLGNNTVLEIVKRKPLNKKDLAGIPGLSPKLIDLMGDVIAEKVTEGLEVPFGSIESFPKRIMTRLTAIETSRIKALKKWREQIGERRGIDPSLVCTNAQIQALAMANPQTPEEMKEIQEIRKWQIEIFGSGICDVLRDVD
jgi:ribonuclease D